MRSECFYLFEYQKEVSELIRMFILNMSQIVATAGRGLCVKNKAGGWGTCFFGEKMLLPMHRSFPRGIWKCEQINHMVDSLPHHFYIAEHGLDWTFFSENKKEGGKIPQSHRKVAHNWRSSRVVGKNLKTDGNKLNICWLHMPGNVLSTL